MNKNKSYNYKYLFSVGHFSQKQRDTFNFSLSSEVIQALFKKYCPLCCTDS